MNRICSPGPEFSGPLRSAWQWDRQLRSLPLRWHPDWLPSGGWPSVAKALPSAAPIPQWVAKRLGPPMGWKSLTAPQLRPALCSLEDAVALLARLAFQLRPQARRSLLTDTAWLDGHAQEAPGCISSHGVVLQYPGAISAGVAEWAAVGLHDWSRVLGFQERGAYLLLRRCFPRGTTLRWIRRLAPHPVERAIDWSALQYPESTT